MVKLIGHLQFAHQDVEAPVMVYFDDEKEVKPETKVVAYESGGPYCTLSYAVPEHDLAFVYRGLFLHMVTTVPAMSWDGRALGEQKVHYRRCRVPFVSNISVLSGMLVLHIAGVPDRLVMDAIREWMEAYLRDIDDRRRRRNNQLMAWTRG